MSTAESGPKGAVVWRHANTTYAVIAGWFTLLLVGSKAAIREPFIQGRIAEIIVNLVIPALVATACVVFLFVIRLKVERSGADFAKTGVVKLSAMFLYIWCAIFGFAFAANFVGVVHCLAYFGEAFPGTPVTHNAEIISERDLKPYSGDLALAHVDLLDESRSTNFAWYKREIRNLMTCPGGRISISGSGTVFGTVVQSVQCSPTPS